MHASATLSSSNQIPLLPNPSSKRSFLLSRILHGAGILLEVKLTRMRSICRISLPYIRWVGLRQASSKQLADSTSERTPSRSSVQNQKLRNGSIQAHHTRAVYHGTQPLSHAERLNRRSSVDSQRQEIFSGAEPTTKHVKIGSTAPMSASSRLHLHFSDSCLWVF